MLNTALPEHRSSFRGICTSLVAAAIACSPFPIEGRQEPGKASVTTQRCAPGACNIELTNQVTLKDSNGRLPTSPPAALARDNAGRVYVAARSKDYVLMFDATGKLAKVIGSTAAASAARGS